MDQYLGAAPANSTTPCFSIVTYCARFAQHGQAKLSPQSGEESVQSYRNCTKIRRSIALPRMARDTRLHKS
ncbi:hypothetical protein ATO10_00795 [Actibacterium atlanticum]|uniref:Uncharacterized protein n=1 Tax=Actibacterium atlanticum TaxID=1461693 RepID=A0A058ZNU4_9RHOB|nr:hypothetical protein ATO10_00795 [Actibacterium atlanticum]